MGFECGPEVSYYSAPNFFPSIGMGSYQINDSTVPHNCTLNYTVGGTDTRAIPLQISSVSSGPITMQATSFNLGGTPPDSTAPALVSASLSPAPAGRGTEVVASASFDEDLAATPQMSLQGQTMVVTGSGTGWTGRVTLSETSFSDGAAALSIAGVVDAAGNAADSIASAASMNIDVTGPSLTAATLTPSVIGAGGQAVATLTYDEALVTAPSVSLQGQAMAVTGSGTDWSAQVSVSAPDFSDGAASLSVSGGQDALGNPASLGVTLPSATLDLTAPQGSAVLSQNLARAGETVTLTLSFSEGLAAVPTVTIGGEAASVSSNGGGYDASLVIPNSLADGQATILIAAQDAAGNDAVFASLPSLTIDSSAPSVTAASLTPSLGRAGQEIVAQLSYSEALTSAPSFTLGNVAMVLSGSGTSWQGRVTLSEAEFSDGPAQFAATGGADAAGNTVPDYTGDSVTVDFTSPNLSIDAIPATLSGALTLTIRADEAVTGLGLDDFAVMGPVGVSNLTGGPTLFSAVLTPSADGAFSVGIASGAAQDTAGNDSGAVSAVSGSVDISAPRALSITRSAPLSEITNADTLTWQVGFSETVSQISGDDFTLTGRTATLAVSASSGASVLVTASGGNLADGSGTVSLGFAGGQDIVDAAGNALDINSLSTPAESYSLDNTAPEITSVSVTPANAGLGQAVTAALTLSEDLAQPPVLRLQGQEMTLLGGPRSYSGQITVGNPLSTGVAALSITGGADAAGNALVVSAGLPSIDIDTEAPLPRLTAITPSPTNAAQIVLEVDFGEAVTGFEASDVSAALGSASLPVAVAPLIGERYRLTLDMAGAGGATGSVSVSIAAGAAQDLAGNPSGASAVASLSYDVQPPEVSLSSTTPASFATGLLEVRIGVSEPVEGLLAAASSLVIGNGSIEGSSPANAQELILTIRPTSSGQVTLAVPSGWVSDALGNASTSTPSLSRSYEPDLSAPQVVSFLRAGGAPAVTNADTLTWRITFSEEITGLTANDFTLTPAIATLSLSGQGADWAEVTASGGGLASHDGTLGIALRSGAGLTDLAGNGVTGPATGESYELDNTAPTLVSTSLTTGPVRQGDLVRATLRFSENLLAPPVLRLGGVAMSVSGSGSQFTGELTIGASAPNAGSAALSIEAVSDLLGQSANLFSNLPSIEIDRSAPVANFGSMPTEVTGPFDLALGFTESVTGLEVADFELTNLQLTSLSGAGQSYTLSLAPITSGPVAVALRGGGVQDAAGNANPAGASASSSADLTGPSVTLSGVASFPGQSYSVTVAFATPVTGLEISDFDVGAAQVSALSGSGADYTLTVTPSDYAHNVSLRQGAAVDQAGRASLTSNTLANTPDGSQPSASFTAPAQALAPDQSHSIDLSFSEAVEGLGLDDFTITNGTLDGVSGAGTSWSVAFTPDGAGDLVLTLLAGAARDVSGEASQTASLTVSMTGQSQTSSGETQGGGTSSSSSESEGDETNPETETTDSGAGTTTNSAPPAQSTPSPSGQMVSDFMQFRTRSFVQMQPNVTPFLQNTATGVFRANVRQGLGTLDFATAGRGPVWATLQGVLSEDDQSSSDFVLAAFGTHRPVLDRGILGVMLQFDHAETVTNTGAVATGRGWMAGPYFATSLRDQPLYLSGRLLYGQSDNTLSPTGTFRDSFDGTRWLAMLALQGRAELGTTALIPRLGFSQFIDQQEAYIDGFGAMVPDQEITQTEVDLGLSLEHGFEMRQGNLTIEWGASGIWTSLEADGAATLYLADREGGRARLNLGASYQSDGGLSARVMTTLDGLGARRDFRAYGLEASIQFEF